MQRPITDDDRQEIIRRYSEGETISSLVTECRRSRNVLKRILQEGGVILRTPSEATLNWLSRVQESGTINTPIECRMQDALMAARIGFRTQRLLLGRYLVDILINQQPVIIEADGMIHTHPQNRAKDALRDAALTEAGYRVFRFTGSEINTDAVACVQRLIDACGLAPDADPVYDIRTSFSGGDHPRWKGGKQEFTCEQCGETFLAQPTHRKGEHVYCGKQCAGDALIGTMISDERKARISFVNKTRPRGPLSAEHKAKSGAGISKALKGKSKSAEHRAALSAAAKGRPKSPEHRAAISATLKRRNRQIKIESELRGDAQRPAETTGPATLF